MPDIILVVLMFVRGSGLDVYSMSSVSSHEESALHPQDRWSFPSLLHICIGLSCNSIPKAVVLFKVKLYREIVLRIKQDLNKITV